MKKAKYICVKPSIITGEIIFIFPETLTHKHVALQLGYDVISAGFVTLYDNDLVCFGESVSLNIKSREHEDNKLLKNMIGNLMK